MPNLSRRDFHRFAALLTAGATLPFYNEQALAQRARQSAGDADTVMIDSNENPMGPCPEAAIQAIAAKGGRYLTSEASRMASTLAAQEGLQPNYVEPFAGSSDALHR